MKRIGIATVQCPFIRGGAESHAQNLSRALQGAGYDVEMIAMPFRFDPVDQVRRCMDVWESEDMEQVNGYHMDRVICMKFPAFYLKHPRKVAWLIHQHRAVYDLWETKYVGDLPQKPEGRALRDEIFQRDTRSLNGCQKVFTIAKVVSDRLRHFNRVDSKPLYHPPPVAAHLYNEEPESYILAPSRLETLKRLDLVIDAMQYVRSPVVTLIAGDGGQKETLQKKIEDLDLGHKVRMIGNLTEHDIPHWYARCLGVFFGPHQEDMGYITLEAMLAAKPVITCSDSGGPLEFVVHDQTGFVVPPDPREVAAAIEKLHSDRRRAAELGRAGLRRYYDLGISWQNVVEALLS
jgi:glycosyltransferase involved in cell wall biosynthesis